MARKPNSLIFEAAKRLILDLYRDLDEGNCDEAEVARTMAQYHPASKEEYINPKDYCSYDEAIDILGMGYNRNKLRALTAKHGIRNHRINNQPIGFKRQEIFELKAKISR